MTISNNIIDRLNRDWCEVPIGRSNSEHHEQFANTRRRLRFVSTIRFLRVGSLLLSAWVELIESNFWRFESRITNNLRTFLHGVVRYELDGHSTQTSIFISLIKTIVLYIFLRCFWRWLYNVQNTDYSYLYLESSWSTISRCDLTDSDHLHLWFSLFIFYLEQQSSKT